MSYSEYIDMFMEAQKQDCPYRAFTFDIVNSRNQVMYFKENKKHYEFLYYVYCLLEREEELMGKQILLKDDIYNKPIQGVANNYSHHHNPTTLGDMATYFVYNGSITTERMLELFAEGLRKFDINYAFHFKTGVYQTNNYVEGGTKLFKGYMPQILENMSKKEDFIITKDYPCLVNKPQVKRKK